jgi:hypothetical protein
MIGTGMSELSYRKVATEGLVRISDQGDERLLVPLAMQAGNVNETTRCNLVLSMSC